MNASVQDAESCLAEVLSALAAAGSHEDSLRIVAGAAHRLAGAEGACLLPAGSDGGLVAFAGQHPVHRCEVGHLRLHRAAVAAHCPEALRCEGDRIKLPTGEEQPISAAVLVPMPGNTEHTAAAFLWHVPYTPDSRQTRLLELLAKALGLAARAWRKNDGHALDHLQRERRIAAELQHRLRNNLALIRSIIRRTSETAESAEQFALHLEGRIAALARTQSSLAAAGEAGLELEELVRMEMLACAVPEQRYFVHGPSIRLHSKGAESIALAMHELATNSLKFGALATPRGQLAVTWAATDSGGSRLHVSWAESGVAIASAAPRRRGFGQELIESTLPYELNARTNLTFGPGGVRCVIDMPLIDCAFDGPIAGHLPYGAPG